MSHKICVAALGSSYRLSFFDTADVWSSWDAGGTWQLATASAPWGPRIAHALVGLNGPTHRSYRGNLRSRGIQRMASAATSTDNTTDAAVGMGVLVLTGGLTSLFTSGLPDVWTSSDAGVTWTLADLWAFPPRSFHSAVVAQDGTRCAASAHR